MVRGAFRARVIARAWSQTWHRAIDQKLQTIGFAAIQFSFTVLATAANEGSAKVMGQAYPYLIGVGVWIATLAVMFLWNLWLAPYELLMEEIGGIGKSSAQLIGAAPTVPQGPLKPTFVDQLTLRMAGQLQHLGEVASKSGFVSFKGMTMDAVDYRDIMDSRHIIWTRDKAKQLRRDFKNAIDRIGTANMELDPLGRQEAATDMVKALSPLVKILLGEEDPGD